METEEAFPREDPGVPEGTHLEEETSSTERETGSAPIRMYFSWQIDGLRVSVSTSCPIPIRKRRSVGSSLSGGVK